MPDIPCTYRSLCAQTEPRPGLASLFDTDWPILNRSAEAPDLPVFFKTFYSLTCFGVCYSTVSKEEADLCADRELAQCPAPPACNPEVDPGCIAVPISDPGTVGGAPSTPCMPGVAPCTDPPIENPPQPPCVLPGQLDCQPPVQPPPPFPPFTPDPISPPPSGLVFNTAQTCVLTCPDGGSFSYTVPAGLFLASNLASANAIAHSYACKKAFAQRICLTSLSPNKCCDNTEFSALIRATKAIVTWVVSSGSLPPGLVLESDPFGEPDIALISGNASQSGVYPFTVRATDAQGNFGERSYTIRVIEITSNDPLPSGQVGQGYSTTLTQNGGESPLSWQVAAGDLLPPGLFLDEQTGVISGTPTTDATPGTVPTTWNFTIVLQDSAT